jgi:hypothetical protein
MYSITNMNKQTKFRMTFSFSGQPTDKKKHKKKPITWPAVRTNRISWWLTGRVARERERDRDVPFPSYNYYWPHPYDELIYKSGIYRYINVRTHTMADGFYIHCGTRIPASVSVMMYYLSVYVLSSFYFKSFVFLFCLLPTVFCSVFVLILLGFSKINVRTALRKLATRVCPSALLSSFSVSFFVCTDVGL